MYGRLSSKDNMNKNIKKQKRDRRRVKIRTRIFGTAKIPRLAVFRSNKFTYAQLIDDENARTLVSASSLDGEESGQILDGAKESKTKVGEKDMKSAKSAKAASSVKKTDAAKAVGQAIAKKALAMKIKSVVFDRGGFGYRGRVRALSEGAREGGLRF